ncbi:MAG: hypothetical protein ILP19_01475 [Oscillospiraceae bacterium]|nr:hypothetical protein [Oscillospiraceae bacterium]
MKYNLKTKLEKSMPVSVYKLIIRRARRRFKSLKVTAINQVLCEEEFLGAFERICFAIISDSNSNRDRNYKAFKSQLDGFVLPAAK